MYFSGNNVFNNCENADGQVCLSVPHLFPVTGKVVKVVFSWSNVGILEKSDNISFKLFGFNHQKTSKTDILDATFSWDRLFILDKDGRCSTSAKTENGEDVVTCRSEVFRGVSAGDSHVFGLAESGKVFSLSLEPSDLGLIPKEIDIKVPVKMISCGKAHTLLLSRIGTVYSFGAGSRAQLGHGNLDVTPIKMPRLVECLEGIIINQVSAGGWHSAAVSDGGDLYMWGWNESGQLGFPSKSVERTTQEDAISFLVTPSILDVGEEEIKEVSCGSRHTAMLTENNSVYTWGWNAYGQLGLGDVKLRDIPTLVEFLKDDGRLVEHIFCGAWNSAFITEEADKDT